MKLYTLMGIAILISFSTAAQQFEGNWMGKLSLAGDLRIVFHISKADNNYKAEMDSPDQGVKGLPVSEITISKDSVLLIIALIKGNYAGRLINDSTIGGTFSQNGMQIPLTLTKVKNYAGIIRLQIPKEPFAYNVKEVEYDNAGKSVHLGATLTYPKANGKFPAAILITGSGQQDRDETILEHKPFAVIADYLTKLGFAVLRVDDRGIGKSKGDVANATTADFANDVETSLAWLKKQDNIDTTRLGLIGHSEGGLIASMIGANNKSLSFIILLAAPGIRGAELMALQNEAILMGQGFKKDAAHDYGKFYLNLADAVVQASSDDSALIVAKQELEKFKSNTSQLTLESLGLAERNTTEENLKAMVKAFRQPWTRYFISSQPKNYIEKINAKVLALNGDKDKQVVAEPNLEGIKAALEKSSSKVYETKLLPGLNHLFQHCKTCSVAEYASLEETFSDEVLQIMGDWLKKEVLKS